jgi:L-threonylcarbamoyladenylate synthase
VFEVKHRPTFDPLIVHVASPRQLVDVAATVPPAAQRLIERFWPGPLTVVLPKAPAVPDLATSGLPAVGVRWPDHPVMQELLERVGTPLAAPSANLFGRISPTTAQHVADQLGDRIDLILEGGPCRVGIESTVLDLSGARPRLLRPGGVSLEDLEAELGRIEVVRHLAGVEAGAGGAPAPGMLERHYAPRTPLRLLEGAGGGAPDADQAGRAARRGLLAFRTPLNRGDYAAVEVLSPQGDLREAAAGFFAALRRLDDLRLDGIDAERFPEAGLGRALNDRLTRAAARGALSP